MHNSKMHCNVHFKDLFYVNDIDEVVIKMHSLDTISGFQKVSHVSCQRNVGSLNGLYEAKHIILEICQPVLCSCISLMDEDT